MLRDVLLGFSLCATASAQQVVDLALTEQDVTAVGADPRDYLGAGVVVGDFNGDGKQDLAMAAAYADGLTAEPRPDAGEIYVYFGPFSRGDWLEVATRAPSVHVLAPASTAKSWIQLASGDVSGDGVDDLILGLTGRTGAGAVFCLFGPLLAGSQIDLARDAVGLAMFGPEGGSLGSAVAAGDVNADGVADLVASAPDATHPIRSGVYVGAVYIMFGPVAPLTIVELEVDAADAAIYGTAHSGLTTFGTALGIGDVSGDAFPDVMVGAEGRDVGGAFSAGEALVLFAPISSGIRDLEVTPADVALRGSVSDESTGRSVLAADLIGDENGDLVIASSADDSSRARVDVFRGPLAPGTVLDGVPPEVRVLGTGFDAGCIPEFFAWALAAGDVSGDGEADLVIGARGGLSPTSGSQTGSVHVLYGPLAPGTIDLKAAPADLTIGGADYDDQLGHAVTLGDLSDDGALDLVVAAARAAGRWNETPSAGEAYVIFGGSGLACLPRPAASAGLRATRRGDDVYLEWTAAADLTTETYDVWAVIDGDKATIPVANRSGEGPDLLMVCPPVSRAAPACVHDGAGRVLPPSPVFYQVRPACADGTEGTHHP